MKDFTQQIESLGPIEWENRYSIKFVLTNPGNSKLQLVKALKDVTGLGIRESKDIVDASCISPVMFNIKLTLAQIDRFKEGLSKCDKIQFELDDKTKIRNKKLIDLGICDVDDIIQEITDRNISNLLTEGFNTTKLRDLLCNIYSKMQEKQLKEIYESTL